MDLATVAWIVLAANLGFAFGLFWAGRDDDAEWHYSKGWDEGFEHGRRTVRQNANNSDAGSTPNTTEATVEIVGRLPGGA